MFDLHIQNTGMFMIGILGTVGCAAAYVMVSRKEAGKKVGGSGSESQKGERIELDLNKLCKMWTHPMEYAAAKAAGTATVVHQTVEVRPAPASQTLPLFGSETIKKFFEHYLSDFIETELYSARLGPSLEAIINILLILDAAGDCPSVVDVFGDPEQKDYSSFYEILRKVTVRDHSLRVAEEAIKIIEEQYREDHDMMIGQVLVVALGHDLGKIPKFRTGGAKYYLQDHPKISEAAVEPYLKNMPVSNRTEILKAIAEHHSANNSPLVQIIREADRRAREKEVTESTGKAVVESRAISWITQEELIAILAPQINMGSDEAGGANIFSIGNTIYAKPMYIAKLARDTAVGKGIAVPQGDDLKALSITIVHFLLRPALSAEVKDGFSGRPCNIKVQMAEGKISNKRMIMTPMKLDAFPGLTQAELELRKTGSLKNYVGVEITPLPSAQ